MKCFEAKWLYIQYNYLWIIISVWYIKQAFRELKEVLFVYLFIHAVNNQLFNTSYIPGTKSGTKDKTVNKSHPVPSFKEFTK